MEEIIISPIQNEGQYRLANADEEYQKAVELVKTHPVESIIDSFSCDKAKIMRANFNRTAKKLADNRIAVTKGIIAQFEEDCKRIEKVLTTQAKAFDRAIKEYDGIKPEFDFIASTNNQDALEKLTAFATSLGVEFKIKEKK